jgi:hypothetical protein
MKRWDQSTVERYLGDLFRKSVAVHSMHPLGEVQAADSIKTYGYGNPVRIDFIPEGEPLRSAVLHTMSPGPFGHEHMADRAQALLWSHSAFNNLPRHARSLDVGAFQRDGRLIPAGGTAEFSLLTEYVDGAGYAKDLERIRETGVLTELDRRRAQALCDYLADIHAVKGGDAGLYTRRVRDLIGHGECIMGLVDSYPRHPEVPAALLQTIEHLCLDWRWKLKGLTHRLRQVHGDFHPWNILFSEGAEFHVLDRSRGEWGDPADDVTCLTANYLFFSLQRSGRLEGAFAELLRDFWQRYLDKTGDTGTLAVSAPYFAFRGLVMASPAWYPSLPAGVRRKLLAFVQAVLVERSFDPERVNEYCGD